MTRSHPTPPRARRAAATAAVGLAAAAALAGCVDRTVAPRELPAGLSLSLTTTMIPNGSLAVDVFYRQDNASSGPQVSLFSRLLQSEAIAATVPASFDPKCAAAVLAGQPANCTVQVPIQIDLARCLADLRRRPEGDGCPISLTLVVRNAAGSVLGQAAIGPVLVVPGRPVVLPTVTLPLRG
jgi:hypothetical protein